MSAFDRLKHWWRARDARERRMLAVMLVLVAAFAYWYGLLWPLRQVRGLAQAHYDRALVQLRDTESAVAAIRAHDARVPETAVGGDTLTRRILDTAASASVAISRQRTDAQGRFNVGVDAVDARTLFAWLDALRTTHGIAPSALRVSRVDGRLRAEAVFDTRAP